MTSVVTKPLPHGSVAVVQVRDTQSRDVMMRLNENIVALKRQLESAQKAIQELQRKDT